MAGRDTLPHWQDFRVRTEQGIGCVGMQVRIRTNSLEFEFAPNSHEFVDHSELEFATSNSNPP